MLKKMRWRFIAAAMGAIVAVVLVLVVGMNLFNYHFVTQRQDAILESILQRTRLEDTLFQHQRPDGERPTEKDRRPGGDAPMPGFFGGQSQEFRYTLRYFTVRCDQKGAALSSDREFIASVTKEEAAQWAEAVVKGGKTSGYHNGYRYLSEATEEGYTVLFLNSEWSLQGMRSTLLVSSAVAAAALAAVFLLVVLFSKQAISPYVRNIETQKRFITDAGHELKTPLTAISASADVLAMDLGEDNEWVSSIQGQCKRLTRLVSNLVTLSRLDEEQPFPDRADFSLSDAVWEISEPMESVAKAKGKTYVQFIDDGLTLHGDRAAVQQMVSILLDNALKYSPEGALIRLAAKKDKRNTLITVFNTCDESSIPDTERLFDRFYRPDPSRAHHTGGTGIGLSIARATAQAHGGTLTAQTGGGGITFTVKL